MEDTKDTYTIEEIAAYIAGQVTGSYDAVRLIGTYALHNALTQLTDKQDGIAACRNRGSLRRELEGARVFLEMLAGPEVFDLEVLRKQIADKEPNAAILQWLCGVKDQRPALFLFCALTGYMTPPYAYPVTYHEFVRCVQMLERFPELEEKRRTFDWTPYKEWALLSVPDAWAALLLQNEQRRPAAVEHLLYRYVHCTEETTEST